MAPNLDGLGVYVLHGTDDDNVLVDQARLAVNRLQEFHTDFVYHEQPDAGHWWDLSEEAGADCVDWAPMFDFLARHRRPPMEEVRQVRFQTGHLGVSASRHWVHLAMQDRPFAMSRVDVESDPKGGKIHGTTENVKMIGFDVGHLAHGEVRVELDGDDVLCEPTEDLRVWLERDGNWQASSPPDPTQKGPRRAGTFKEAFNHRVQLVVGTQGSAEETAWAWAKARYDAEYLWYQGNATLDVVADTQFDPLSEPDRNVILYGNADTHAHWSELWGDTVRVERGRFAMGDRTLEGNDLGVIAVRPRSGSNFATVGIVSGTGASGLRLTNRRPYLAPGIAYPDVTVFHDSGEGEVVAGAGFFGNDWAVSTGEFVWRR